MADRKQIQDRVMMYLEQALEMEVGMSPDDTAYDIAFIAKKLALCSTHMEALSGIQIQLTKIGLYVTRQDHSRKNALSLQEAKLKASDEYGETPRVERKLWLEDRLREQRQEHQDWMDLRRAVSEVKDAVAERAGLMKRLDSDLRLHSKLYDTKVAAGATPPPTFSGQGEGSLPTEQDLDLD